MKLVELEKSFHVLNYLINNDEKTIDIFLKSDIFLEENYFLPFCEELNYNLLLKGSKDEIEIVIRYYIFQLSPIHIHYKDFDFLLSKGFIIANSDISYEFVNLDGVGRELDEFEIYLVRSKQLFMQIFDEIYNCCFKYEIDFLSICEELKLPIEYTYLNPIYSMEVENDFSKQRKEVIINKTNEIDSLRSTLDIWLDQFKENLSEIDKEKLGNAFYTYFKKGHFPEVDDIILVRGAINKKFFGWKINELLASQGKELSKEVLVFANRYISKYTNYSFDENNYTKGNLYKCFKTRVDFKGKS